ncbi:MAG: hypothetical protein CGW95_04915 [Phenylobacterium zucineum]|nr:MAG: hypothetical protein CGW95_04915 [Phenylobacterium zucineum]
MTEQTFAERLLQHRSNLGISQEAVGSILGVSSQTISNWEAGTAPRKSRLAQALTWMASGLVPPVEPAKLRSEILSAEEIKEGEATELGREPIVIEKARRLASWQKRQDEEKQFAEDERSVFKQAIPDALKQYVDPPVVTYQNLRLPRVYLSPKVSVTMVFPQVHRGLLKHAALVVAALKTLDTEAGHPCKYYALIIAGADSGEQVREASLTTVAGILGIDMYFVPDPLGAAAVVAELENADPTL